MSYAWECGRCRQVVRARGGAPPRFCPRCGTRLGGPPLEVPGPEVRPRRAGGAVAALALGLISFFLPGFGLVLGLLAVAVGISAQQRIRRSDGVYSGEGLAAAGIVLGVLGSLFQMGFCARMI
jgi:hypothetical protein